MNVSCGDGESGASRCEGCHSQTFASTNRLNFHQRTYQQSLPLAIWLVHDMFQMYSEDDVEHVYTLLDFLLGGCVKHGSIPILGGDFNACVGPLENHGSNLTPG